MVHVENCWQSIFLRRSFDACDQQRRRRSECLASRAGFKPSGSLGPHPDALSHTEELNEKESNILLETEMEEQHHAPVTSVPKTPHRGVRASTTTPKIVVNVKQSEC